MTPSNTWPLVHRQAALHAARREEVRAGVSGGARHQQVRRAQPDDQPRLGAPRNHGVRHGAGEIVLQKVAAKGRRGPGKSTKPL